MNESYSISKSVSFDSELLRTVYAFMKYNEEKNISAAIRILLRAGLKAHGFKSLGTSPECSSGNNGVGVSSGNGKEKQEAMR